MRHAAVLAGTLAVAALFFAVLLRFRGAVLVGLGILLVAFPVLYLLFSVFSPAKPDRKCPECGAEALVPLVPGQEIGTRCTTCGHVDEAASNVLLDADGGD